MLSECPQCGQKLRARWARCPRCRLLLDVSADPTGRAGPSSQSIRARLTWSAAAVVLIAVIVFSLRGASAPATAVSSPSAAAPQREVVVGPLIESRAEAPEATGSVVSFASADLRRQAAAAYAQGDFASALQHLEAAVAASPNDPEARNNLGQLLIRQGRAAEALPHFDQAVTLNERNWSYRFNRARAYGLVDRWAEAVADYRVAVTLFPGDHATLYNLGLALLRIRDYPAAATALEDAVEAAPDQHDFLITLGTAYVGASQPDRARQTLERFLEVAPDDPDAPRVKALLQAMAHADQ